MNRTSDDNWTFGRGCAILAAHLAGGGVVLAAVSLAAMWFAFSYIGSRVPPGFRYPDILLFGGGVLVGYSACWLIFRRICDWSGLYEYWMLVPVYLVAVAAQVVAYKLTVSWWATEGGAIMLLAAGMGFGSLIPPGKKVLFG
ncbi:MAG: hypothetical protein LLG01_00255 [Planctomycetaceae bacterium]|nr:hypothetical protein [Planctomycetaceae bacterium]